MSWHDNKITGKATTKCDECEAILCPGQEHYRIEGEGVHFCSDECFKFNFDICYGDGNWRCDGDEEENAAGGYYSVFFDDTWHPLNLYWTEMEEEEE